MAGPGGNEVERISVKVVPDTSGFAEKLKRFLDEQEKKSSLDVRVQLDTKDAEAQLKRLSKDLSLKLKVNADTAAAKTQIDTLSKNLTATINTRVDDLAAKTELDILARDRHVNIKTDVDRSSLSSLSGALSGVETIVRDATLEFTKVLDSSFSDVEESASSATSSFGNIGATLGSIGAVARVAFFTVIIPALAGVVIAAGAVAGALALAFAPVGVLALGASILLIGKKSGIVSARVKKEFGKVKTTLQGVLKEAVKPLVDQLEKNLPGVISFAKKQTEILRSIFFNSSKFLPDLFSGVKDSIRQLLLSLDTVLADPNLKPAVQGFSDLFVQISVAIGSFFKTLVKFGPDFKTTLGALGEAFIRMAPALANLLGAFAKVAPELINRIGAGITRILEMLSDPNVVKGLERLAEISFDTIIFALELLIEDIGALSSAWDGLKKNSKQAAHDVETAFNGLVGFLNGLWPSIKKTAGSAWDGIKNAITHPMESAKETVSLQIQGIKTILSNAWSTIKSGASTQWNAIKSVISTAINGAKNTVSSAINSIKNTFSSAKTFISNTVNSIKNAINDVIGAARRAANFLNSIDLNPFNASAPEFAQPGDASLSPVSGPLPMGAGLFDFQADLSSMSSEARSLTRANQRLANRSVSGSGSLNAKDLVQKIQNITVNEAKGENTVQSVLKALSYADALFAN